jgi:signal transduction histidine kinase
VADHAPKALLVDDDMVVQEYLSQTLGKMGIQVSRANDGVEGLAAVAKEPFDLVLLDIEMPRLSGVPTLEGIKKKDPSIEVIMVTAQSSVNIAVACMKIGAYDYVTKPFSPVDLEAIVRGALERRRLGRMLAELDQLSQMKTAFLANVSHELRTPLASMLGFSSMLLKGDCGPLNDQQLSALGRMESNAQQLLSVVNTLLDYVRFTGEEATAKKADAQIAPLVEMVLREFAQVAKLKKISLAMQIPTGLYVRTDSELLTKVLRQLVSNGVKFTEKGGVVVSGSKTERSVVLQVKDSGIGIDPRDLAILFEEFRQSDPSPSRKHTGTGLGLAVVKRLASVLGAKISFESKPGEGAVFNVELPI